MAERVVVVVGAGPVGLVLALQLASRGRSVTVVERFPSTYPRPRAVAFDDEAARVLQSLGLMDEVLAVSKAGGNLYHWWNADDECLLLIDNRGMGACGWPKKVQFTQPQLEEVLLRHARQHPLIDVRFGAEVVDVAQDSEGATVTLAGGEVLRAGYVVGCDGANSIVRAHMDTDVVDLGFYYDWLILDVIPPTGWTVDPISLQRCDPSRPATIIPSGPGRRRWEFMVLPDDDVAGMDTEDTAWRLLEPWGLDSGNAVLERHTVYRFQARWASRWNDGRLLLAGDSAHLMPPFAGQGLCSGIRDAANLAWKLDLVLAGTAHESLLDTYTAERALHVQHAIHFSIELGKVICILDPEEAAERDRRMLQFAGAPERVLPTLPAAAFDVGAVRLGAEGVAAFPAGTLSPQGRVRGNDGEGLLDDVIGSTGVLLVLAGAGDALTADDRSALGVLGIPVVTVLPADAVPGADEVADLDGVHTDEFARLGGVAVLVRPDLYYFGSAADAADVVDLVREFRGALIRVMV